MPRQCLDLYHKKGKVIPLQAQCGPEGGQTMALEGGELISTMQI